MAALAPSATSGVPALDQTLGGFFWGDNVVWEVGHGESVLPFEHAIVEAAPQFAFTTYVAFTRTPDEVHRDHPGIDLLDLREADYQPARQPPDPSALREGGGGVDGDHGAT